MAVWSIINANGIASSGRCDAEYFTPENLRLAATLEKQKPVRIDSFAGVTDGIHGSPEWDNEGVTYLSAKCVREHFVDIKAAGQISAAQDAANPRTRARVGDVVITSVGTIGNAAVVEDWMLPANMDRHLGIIRIRDHKKVDPYFLATFLNSEFGRFQTIRESTGNVQLNLFIEKIRGILVPTSERLQEVGKLARRACADLRSADALYPEAEAELLERLGWDELQRRPVELSFVRNFEEINISARADAEFYRSEPRRVLNALIRNKSQSVGELCYFVEHGQQPEYVDDGTVGIVSQRQFRASGLDLDLLENFTSASFIVENPKFALQKGDVLAYCVSAGDYLGRTFLFNSDVPCVAASFVTILRTKKIVPGYLALFLNSPVGLIQSNMFKRGTSPFYLYPRDLRQVLIYCPCQKNGTVDLAWQKRLAAKVEAAAAAKTAARSKLEEAKRLVEKALQ